MNDDEIETGPESDSEDSGDSDDSYDDDGYGGSGGDASYSAERWAPTETSALLLAGRSRRATDEALTFAEVKAAVAVVEALGGGLTLVLPGDTTTTGPQDTGSCQCELVVGVVVASVWANDGSPTRVNRAAALRELASAPARDHAAIAAALPEPLRASYLAASDGLRVVPVGPLPYTYLVYGVAGVAGSEGLPGKFIRGTDMQQEGHTDGVWGEKIASGEFTDVRTVELDREDSGDGVGYWLIAGYD